MKTRTALLIVVVGTGAFVAAEIGQRNAPTQTPSAAATKVVQYADPKAEVKAEPTLPTDPEQRAIDAELNRAIKRAIDVELNGAIMRALSDATEDDLKHRADLKRVTGDR